MSGTAVPDGTPSSDSGNRGAKFSTGGALNESGRNVLRTTHAAVVLP